jgi:hypothetical protein
MTTTTNANLCSDLATAWVRWDRQRAACYGLALETAAEERATGDGARSWQTSYVTRQRRAVAERAGISAAAADAVQWQDFAPAYACAWRATILADRARWLLVPHRRGSRA